MRADTTAARYDWFWPLGEPVHVEALKDEYVPFQGLGEIPDRPGLALEVGDGFLDTGQLDAGFEVPLIGAVWQPRLWTYFINRLTLQSFDDGTRGNKRETEIANRLDLFFNLQLTGTEKILLGFRPTDNNEPDCFTRYTFSGATNDDIDDETNIDIENLFFEGDIGSLVPNLDIGGFKPIDFGFTVGRQLFTFQEGILLNDTLDSVGFVRNNIPFPHTSNLRISGMWGWDRIDRNDDNRGADPNIYTLFTAVDAPVSTFNLDMIYINDNAPDDTGDAFYIGGAAIQRIKALGGMSTAFRVNSLFALDEEVAGNVVGDGTLFTGEFSITPVGSNDIAYFNPYVAVGNFTQAGREVVLGGPLANTGVLFASPNLSTYGAEINPFVNDDFGFAVGYQAFWDGRRRNLVLELATKKDFSGAGNDAIGLGFQLQQALWQYVQLQFEGFQTFNDSQPNGSGGHFEILVVY